MTPSEQWHTLLPTTVVGSYSVPEWLERLKTEYYQRRISAQHLAEIYEVAIKAAVKDQELAGIDIVSDGELRRDNDIDYFLARIPGVRIAQRSKADYYDYYEAEVSAPLPEDDKSSLGLAADFEFTRQLTDRPVKFSFTGPFSLSRRITRHRLLRARRPGPRAGQEAQPGGPLARRRGSRPCCRSTSRSWPATRSRPRSRSRRSTSSPTASRSTWALHVCYGNRYARPSWEGHYDFLFPAVLDARVDQLVLEFARKGLEDLRLLRQYSWQSSLGLGVIDVKSAAVESPELVAARITRALEYVEPGRLMINPDCGLRHLAPDVARRKLRAMVSGAAIVRSELGRTRPATKVVHPTTPQGDKPWIADSSSRPSR